MTLTQVKTVILRWILIKSYPFYESLRGNIKDPLPKQRVLEVKKKQIKCSKVAISSDVRRIPDDYYWISKYNTMQVSLSYFEKIITNWPYNPDNRNGRLFWFFSGNMQRADMAYIKIKAIKIFVSNMSHQFQFFAQTITFPI